MECFGGDVNRIECGTGVVWRVVRWWMDWGCGWLGWGGVKSGFRRLCVVCATTETCCKCNNSIQNAPPG